MISEIARQYNFKTEINYEIKPKYGDHQLLLTNKTLGKIQRYIHEDQFIVFMINKNMDKKITTYENLYVALMNLNYFCIKKKIKINWQ